MGTCYKSLLVLQSNQQFLQTVTEQNVELEQLRKQLRYKTGN